MTINIDIEDVVEEFSQALGKVHSDLIMANVVNRHLQRQLDAKEEELRQVLDVLDRLQDAQTSAAAEAPPASPSSGVVVTADGVVFPDGTVVSREDVESGAIQESGIPSTLLAPPTPDPAVPPESLFADPGAGGDFWPSAEQLGQAIESANPWHDDLPAPPPFMAYVPEGEPCPDVPHYHDDGSVSDGSEDVLETAEAPEPADTK